MKKNNIMSLRAKPAERAERGNPVNTKRHISITSFTLIEVIVSLAVIGLVIPAIFSIVFVLMNQQAKIQRLKIIKQEGDYILNHISNQIKNNAIGVIIDNTSPPPEPNHNYDADPISNCGSVANDDGSNFYFIDKGKNFEVGRNDFNNWFKYVLSVDNKISSQSSTTTPVSDPIFLNSDNVRISQITPPPSMPAIPFVSCIVDSSNVYSPPVISVNFRIEYKTNSTRVEDKAFFNYQGSFKLRTY